MRELIIGMGDINGYVGRNIDGFLGVHCIDEGNQERRMLLELCDVNLLCFADTWFIKADKKKLTYGSGCSESEIDFV